MRRKEDAVYLDEFAAAARSHLSFQFQLVCTDRDGLLAAEEALTGRAASDVWVDMCGPPPMTAALAKGLARAGVSPACVRWEQFDIR